MGNVQNMHLFMMSYLGRKHIFYNKTEVAKCSWTHMIVHFSSVYTHISNCHSNERTTYRI